MQPLDRRANTGKPRTAFTLPNVNLGEGMFNFFSPQKQQAQQQQVQNGDEAADVVAVEAEVTGEEEVGASEQYNQERRRRESTLKFGGGFGSKNTWNVAAEASFKVRSKHYATNKQKCQSHLPPYSPLEIELYSCSKKRDQVSRCLDLPSSAGRLGHLEGRLPRFIVITLQGPLYPPSFFGKTTDGPGLISPMVFEFNGRHIGKEALSMLEGIYKDAPAPCGGMCRERFKMIATVRNAQYLMQNKLIGTYETTLLSSYNSKPVLTKPCHRFYTGPNYLEVDFDIHEFSWVPRRVWHNSTSTNQISNAIADIGFLVQGNGEEELPEQILGAVQYSCINFKRDWPNPPGFPE